MLKLLKKLLFMFANTSETDDWDLVEMVEG